MKKYEHFMYDASFAIFKVLSLPAMIVEELFLVVFLTLPKAVWSMVKHIFNAMTF